jgi:hypothetical protein
MSILGVVFLIVAAFPPANSTINFLPLGLACWLLSTFV